MDASTVQAGSNGDGRKTRLLSIADLDGRTRARRRAEELRERVVSERGGADRMDALRLVHADSWAILTALIEDQIARLMLGEAVDPAGIATLINTRRREGEVIGSPEPRDVTPTLAQYLASKAPMVTAGPSE